MTSETKRAISPGAESVLGKYFPVLDHGFIALVDYMGSDGRIAESARVSYGIGTKAVNNDENLIRYLMRHNHSSPLEQVKLSFHVGLPIFVMRQLVRHRMSNLNEYSARYSIVPLLYYTPRQSEVKRQSKANRQGGSDVVSEEYYDEYLSSVEATRGVASENYINLIHDDIARETARIDLPLSTYTYAYWSIDLRNMFNVIRQRSDSHAQWETLQYSDIFGAITKLVAPFAFNGFLDYQFHSTSFTDVELEGLRSYDRLGVGTNITKVYIDEYFQDNGLNARERAEFWNKIKPKERKEFNLDINSAREASYFQEMAAANAVEKPESNQ